MDILSSKKLNHLLNGSVDVLHEESHEWLSEIAFWRDEAAFLYTMMMNHTLRPLDDALKNESGKIEGELISITGGELDDLDNAVKFHEDQLNFILLNKYTDESGYKEQHKQLYRKIKKFEKRFKILKREAFAFIRKIDNNIKK